ncbi:hypothetical protein PENCOP_c002G06086 [Penicillium coprophilum]|uniref:Oxidoreductase AflY n=1 Tax=Penicillium coprophilum TaxID=36646 RepID=A0A1V6V099_9EURO|nr:hypothetical protein PENCOP_c002G06086 [Penicillium coprophilum]
MTQPTATTVILSPETTPGHVHVNDLTRESALLVSELLTKNHTLYKTRWKLTLHNHLTHHLLAMWALGATPAEIQDMWDYNTPYQDDMNPGYPEASFNDGLHDPEIFEKCLGIDDCYPDFLKFFEEEITSKGMQEVVKEYLFKGDGRANDILGRMFADLVHPMIHLGCGIEFNQPSLVAEALAGACVHDNWPSSFLLPTEEYVRANPDVPSKSMLQILDSLQADSHISTGTREDDPFNKIPDGFLKRVTPTQLVPYLSQFQVKAEPADLKLKLSDMMHTSAYMLGAAQRPGKREAMDFVTLHAATLAAFLPAILAQDWLSNEDKARLLEATVRVDAVMYAGTACPPLYADRVVNYMPQYPTHGWSELFHRANVYQDEGHAVKLLRALYALEPLELSPDFPITKSDFLMIAHMGIDSIERAMTEEDGNNVPKEVAAGVLQRVGRGGEMVVGNMTRWVFYGGLPNAWRHVPAI